jgi:Sugar-transfer associated ATP-grasp
MTTRGKAGAPIHPEAPTERIASSPSSPPDGARKTAPPARRIAYSPSAVLRVLSGAPLPWALIRDDGSPSRYLHRSLRRYAWQRHGTAGRALLCAGFVAGAPAVLAMIAVCLANHGSRVRKAAGKGALRQASEQLALWLTKGVLPLSYYAFELYRHDSLETALDYLFRYETKGDGGMYDILRRSFSSPETTEALRSKASFARRCLEHGVPAVPVLFTVEGGEITRLDADEPGLPRRDLFLKPLSGSGGRGAAVWTCLENGTYRNAAAGVLSESDLSGHIAELSRREPYVGRLCVSNHPELAQVSSGALCSVRVLTCQDENGRPEVTHAVLRMPRTPGIVVDNFHAGGIAAAVDLDTGIIGAATDLGLNRRTQWFDTHPITGAAIRGRRIPMWSRVLEVARSAHAAFADQVVVGWDVAVLESGPQMIEGNKSPDLDIIQRTSREPIGNSRFGVLMAHHLRRVLEQR